VIYANGLLRRRLGADPRVQPGFSPAGLAKVALARAAKALNLQPPNERVLPVTFNLEKEVPGIDQAQAA
jgi:hypothetical protein